MAIGRVSILTVFGILFQSPGFAHGINLAGDEPWYKNASYYWPFNSLLDPGVVDQRGTSSVPGYSKNGLKLDGLLGSWVELGNFSYHCISNPDACKAGFTVTFWLRVNDIQSNRVFLQIATTLLSVGTVIKLNGGVLGVFVNSPAVQRHVEVKWPYYRWVFVSLTWNRLENNITVLLNGSSVPYVTNTVKHSYILAPVPPYHTLILGANNARTRSMKMIVDELALWNAVLTREDVRYIMECKAVNGAYTRWSNYSSCTVSCGTGTKTRNRSCTNPRPQHGGNDCRGSSTQTERCFLRNCPINGNYSEWTQFSSCSLTCGGGERFRTRTCTNPRAQYGGLNCSGLGPNREVQDCNTQPCPINGGYSEWSNFSACSVSCNSGIKTRYRLCINPQPQHAGRNCSNLGPAQENRSCFLKVCPVDGNYGNWSSFGICSKTCGRGEKIRTRKCDSPAPVGEGRNCSRLGPSIDIQPCNTHPCPVSGGYTLWSNYSTCTKSCGGGMQYRARNCTNPPPEAGGEDCTRLGPPKEIKLCNTKACPVDGGYGDWSSFTQCSKTCGHAKKERARKCNSPPPQNGGLNCSRLGPALEIRTCDNAKCPSITFVASVTFTNEKFNMEILNRKSATFKELEAKIKYNVYEIYDEKSALESVAIQWCGYNERMVFVQCSLQFEFMAERYAGIVELQDALMRKGMLYSMPLKTQFLSSNHVPSYAPETVTLNNISSRSLNVTWTKIGTRGVTVGGGDILGYRLMYWDDEGNVRDRVISGEENTHTELKKLRIYSLYCVRIMAYNRRGDGMASLPVCAHTGKDVPDAAPPNVIARNLSSTELLVEWDPLPAKFIHGVLLGYRIKLTRNGINFTKIVNISPSATSHHITGLKRYTRYVLNIAAINDVGEGVSSNSVTVWTEEDVPSRPPNISDIYYTSSTSIRVEWEPLSQRYIHGRLLGYQVVYRRVEGGNHDNWNTILLGPKTIGVNITGLKKYGAYVVQVGAFTRKGNGTLTKGLMLRTDEDVPSQPPQNVTVAKDNSTSTSLFVHWRPVPANHQNGKILGYRILYKKSLIHEKLRTKNISAESTATELKNLTKYTEYDITILAYTSKGNGVRARFFKVSTTEDRPSKPPTLTSVHNTSSTTIKVNWRRIPQEFIHGKLVGFVVLYRAMNESQDMYKDMEVGPTETSLELKGLWKYTKYGIRVLGFTRVGWGVISLESVVQTDEDAPGRPPENVFATNKTTPTMIPVSWRPISNPYYIHGILRGYTVTYRAIRNPNKELHEREKNIIVGPRTLSVQLHNLSSFTIYSIEVRAFTAKGNGTPSLVIFAETCNCYSMLYTNYWYNPPYMDKGSNGNTSGIFPPILQLVVRSCCGVCAAHSHTEIDFRFSSNNKSANKNTQKEVREAIDDVTELSFPVNGRMDQTDYSNEYGFAPLVQSAGVAFIVAEDEPGATAKMVVKAVFDLWPLIITVFISAFFTGIVMWLLDFVFNSNEFPASPMRGPIEGMWWAFVTMTTVGYGDRVPRALHSKLFGIVWIICGLVIIALVMSFITTSLTTDIIKSDIPVYGSRVAAIDDSPEFRLGIRLNARMDRERKYTTLMDLYRSLKDRHVEGALIDSYTVGSRMELFSDGAVRANKMIDYSLSYGVVMAGYASKLQKCFREFLKEEKAAVFEIIKSNVHGISGLQKKNAADKTEGLFDAESHIYTQTMIWCGGIMALLVILSLMYELLTRKNRTANPKRYEYSDYLQDLRKQDQLYEYKYSKETMKQILTDFHKNCCLRLKNLKDKHRRELALLSRLKQETGERGETNTLTGSVKRSLFGFTARNSIVRYVNGVVP